MPALALACGCGTPQPPAHAVEGQAYRPSVTTAAGDEIPFFLELPSNCNTDRAAIVNGTERISVPSQRLGGRVLLDLIVYGTRISAEIDARGNLEGHWSRSGGIDEDRFRFAARPLVRVDPGVRFIIPDVSHTAAAAAADVGGTWRVEFVSHGLAKASFTPVGGGVLHGTAEVPSEYGDLRYLAGNVHDSSVSVSTFDGASAYLIEGRLDADGRLRGRLVGSGGANDAFVASRSEDFDVIDPLQRVRLTTAETRLDLAPLLGARYAGKSVIVQMFGTWCSNCNDLTPLLVDLYGEHQREGLEILSLAYELSDDEAYRRERLAAYRTQHGVEWETLIPGGSPEDLLSVGPATFSPISGIPVTFFVNRDRTIRAIYTGFWGPATGASHGRATATFRRLTKEILATVPLSR